MSEQQIIRCAFFDDKVTAELPDMQGGVLAGLNRIDDRLTCNIEPHVRYFAGRDRIADHDHPLHLAIIDVFWSQGDQGPVDAAEDLLGPALARSDTVVLLASGGDGALTNYLYHPAKTHIRPHAVFHKGANKRAELMEGILRAAFSAAGRRLNSLVVDVRWDEDEHEVGLNEVDKLCLEELACRTVARADSVIIRPIGGGLSGAITLLLEGNGVDRQGNPSPQVYLLKAHRDVTLLGAELAAHRDNAKKLAPGLFARPVRDEIFRFGGWAAIAFDQAPGRTASAVRATSLNWEAWPRLFSKATVTRLAKIARQNDVEPSGALLKAPNGAVGGGRPDRFISAVADLGVAESSLTTLTLPLAGWFSTELTPVTVGHGDLHTRNVLVDTDGTVVWVDAASMLSRSHWASDLARFSTWLAFELVEDQLLEAADVASGLAINSDVETTAASLASELRRCVEATLAQYESAFGAEGRRGSRRQWQDAVTAEVMRIVYSRDTFSRSTRLAACELLVQLAVDGSS